MNLRHSVPTVDRGCAIVRLKSWKEFPDYICETKSNTPALIYRGQANAEWMVDSTLDRLERKFPTKKNFSGGVPNHFECPPTDRDTHLKAFKEAVRGRRGENPAELSDDEWWALAQHHGLATPLLDFTYSPFVALFFAFEQEQVLSAEKGELTQPDERAVYALSSSCIHDTKAANGDEPPRPFSPLRGASHRLINQGALFVRMPQGTDLESYVRTHFKKESTNALGQESRCILEKIAIPNKDRIECLKYLNKMNINRMSLFPDLDGAAAFINALWEMDFDTALGYLPEQLPDT